MLLFLSGYDPGECFMAGVFAGVILHALVGIITLIIGVALITRDRKK